MNVHEFHVYGLFTQLLVMKSNESSHFRNEYGMTGINLKVFAGFP